MSSPARDYRARAQETWPGATVHGRGQNWIRHQHPTDPTRLMLDTTIGSMHYLDGDIWQEIDSDWQDSDDADYIDMVSRSDLKSYAGSNGERRVYPRRDVITEYISFGRMQYWTGNQWRNVNMGTKNRSLDHLTWSSATLDIALISEPDKLKLHYIAKTSNAPTRARWVVTLTGLTLNTSTWELTSISEGITIAALRQPTIISDSNGRLSPPHPVEMSYDGTYLELNADFTGLTYPITIDPTIDNRVNAGANDGLVDNDDYFDNTAQYPECGYTYQPWYIYQRFTGITGLSGATIDVSQLTLQDALGGTFTFHLKIDAEDAAAPTQITSWSDWNGRTRTTNKVDWDIVSGSSDGDGHWHSPSINTVIQELADDYDPSVIQISVINDGGTTSQYFTVVHYNGSSTEAPLLHIEYTAGGGAFTVNVHEDVALSESKTVSLPDALAKSLSDSTGTTTESIGRLLTSFVNITTEISGITEAVMVAVSLPGISTNENVILTEDADVSMGELPPDLGIAIMPETIFVVGVRVYP